MKHQTFLQQFKYTIPATSVAFTEKQKSCGRQVAAHLPLLNLGIDFTNGELYIDADWLFIASTNLQMLQNNIWAYRERVKIEAFLDSSIEIDLEEQGCNGLLFPFEGKINDGNMLCSCNGLIILDADYTQKPLNAVPWMLSIYLYDALVENFDIKLRLPLYYNTVSSINN